MPLGMQLLAFWILLGGLAVLAIYQQLSIYLIRREAKKKEELFQIVTENAADMIALVDMKGRRLYNSPAYKRILGYSSAELGETSAFEQIHPDDRFRVLEASREARASGVGKRMEYRIKHKDGSWRVLESLASAVRDAKGEVAKLVIVNRDISDRKRAEEQLERNLFHDPLTGLPNRRQFLERLENAYTRSRRDAGQTYSLLLANLDHFKVFNESMGSGAGDQILKEIARRIDSDLVKGDAATRNEGTAVFADAVLFRLGGDEFAVLLEAVGDPSDALRCGHKILQVVAEPLTLDARELRVSASIGIALSTDTHARPEDLLKDADVAMRRAKALGGSRCEVFDEAMHSRAVGRLRLEADLRAAITQQQFRIYYQPVLHLETRRIVSFEALLRWEHPTQGLISPYRFIEAAEDTGILVSIGRWLILGACQQLREWEKERVVDSVSTDKKNAGKKKLDSAVIDQPMCVTVNVSARLFADARLANDIQDALRQSGIDPARLQLEVIESVAAADPKLTITVLSQLKHLGIGVILDNCTGMTSLRGLRQFPVNALKIDRSLVREMQSDRAAGDIVELIIGLARKMNLKAIAEGIETVRQVERLIELGCSYGQGYYFSQPMDAKAAQQFMSEQAVSARARGAAK